MNWFRIYEDISNEIAFFEFRISDLEKEYEFWYRTCFSAGKKPIAPLDICLRRMNKIVEDVVEYSKLLEMKLETKQKMDDQLEKLDSREYEVVKLNVFEGNKLKIVAKKMNISEAYAKKISASAKKKLVV